MVTAAYGTFVYQLDGAAPTNPSFKCWKYATTTDAWASIKAIPTSSAGVAAGVGTVGTQMYVFGCAPNPGVDPTLANRNQKYDTTTDTWAIKCAMPNTHQKGAVGVRGNKIYVAGGAGAINLDIYDAVADTWTSGTARLATCSALPWACLRQCRLDDVGRDEDSG
jgi:hypothetical protein